MGTQFRAYCLEQLLSQLTLLLGNKSTLAA
jgi:hypothetical protein